MVNTTEALQRAVDAYKRAYGQAPNQMVVGIDLAKEIRGACSVMVRGPLSEQAFLNAIEKGQVQFNSMKLQAGWV